MKLQVNQLTKLLSIPPGSWKALQSHLAKPAKDGDISRWPTIARSLGVLLMFFSAIVITSPSWAAGGDKIAVIYPDLGDPYRDIFAKIIEGIEDEVGTRVANFPVSDATDTAQLNANLLRQNIKVVIALGRQGMKTAASLKHGINVVVGGVLTMPENETREQPVVSLSPDPALLFARMKILMPSTKRVFVVYDPRFSGWLMKLAREAAHAQGLELVAYEALDVRSAVHFYQKIFSDADGQDDVLWLPQDPTTVEDSSILPLVLQESWNQGIAVFSSNFSYVRRGVLFSLYPDNMALGKSLGALAQGILISGDYGKRGMIPLRDVQSAVNLRTAKHLGINSNRRQSFDLTFPEQ